MNWCWDSSAAVDKVCTTKLADWKNRAATKKSTKLNPVAGFFGQAGAGRDRSTDPEELRHPAPRLGKPPAGFRQFVREEDGEGGDFELYRHHFITDITYATRTQNVGF